MEKKQNGMDDWIVRATQQIKFTPDRSAVAAELREHIEDKIFDIRRIYSDITEDEAIQRALKQMGDAEEVGRELAKIHTPWLGYLWRASQVFLAILLMVALYLAQEPLWRVAPNSNWKETREGHQVWFPEELPASTPWGAIKAIGKGSQTASVGTYTIEITRASVFVPDDGKSLPRMNFTLRFETTRPWELPDEDLGTWISVSDSAGYYWSGHRERDRFDGRANVNCGWVQSGLNWREYEGYASLYNIPAKYIPERPWEQEYTVHFNDGQTSFAIPIMWEEVAR